MHFSRVLILILLFGLGSGLTACVSTEEYQAQNPIVYGLSLEPSGIDPHIHQSAELGIVLRQVYDTLVYRNPETREIVPGLANDWTISDDNLSYTFSLKQDVTFHDGTPFNAQAVAANLDRITNPDTRSQKAAFLLGPYEGYDILDEYMIRVNLSEPFSPLLDSFSQVYLGMASPTALAEYSNLRYQFHQVGTGPYEFVKYTPGDKIVLRRAGTYTWGPPFYETSVENAVDEITYRFFTDAATRGTALESGEAQIMGELPPSTANTLTASGGLQVLPTDVPGMPLQFMMNTEQAPTDNRVVRQALLHATNRGIIVDTVYRGFSPVAWGPISRDTLYYTSDVEGRYTYDVNQARSLLESVGWSDTNDDDLLDDGSEPLSLTMIVPPWGQVPEVAQLIQDQWREVGISVTLEQVAGFSALREEVDTGEYNLVAFNTFGYDPYILNTFYTSDGANNFMNYSNPELDTALNNAMQALAPNTRRMLYGRIQQFIMDEALILPIRDYVNLNATASGIEGLRFDPYGWFPLMNDVSYSGE